MGFVSFLFRPFEFRFHIPGSFCSLSLAPSRYQQSFIHPESRGFEEISCRSFVWPWCRPIQASSFSRRSNGVMITTLVFLAFGVVFLLIWWVVLLLGHKLVLNRNYYYRCFACIFLAELFSACCTQRVKIKKNEMPACPVLLPPPPSPAPKRVKYACEGNHCLLEVRQICGKRPDDRHHPAGFVTGGGGSSEQAARGAPVSRSGGSNRPRSGGLRRQWRRRCFPSQVILCSVCLFCCRLECSSSSTSSSGAVFRSKMAIGVTGCLFGRGLALTFVWSALGVTVRAPALRHSGHTVLGVQHEEPPPTRTPPRFASFFRENRKQPFIVLFFPEVPCTFAPSFRLGVKIA